jgi:hypothetical protein
MNEIINENSKPKSLSCTITPEDRKILNDLTLYISNKEQKVVNTSAVVRALIRLGEKYKKELEL